MRYGGECDLSILDNFFEDLPDHITGTFVIKSTVPIGTTKKYLERHNVIHNPEFLTARNAIKILLIPKETLSVETWNYAMTLLLF
jgi:UDP-glucose 6-dehydrogenase